MARRSTPIGFLAGALALFIIIILILSLASHTLPLPTGGINIPGIRMTEEVQPPEVLYSTTLNLEPGTVWQVTYNVDGIRIEQKSSQLIEKLELSNVDLSLNDVVAPHLWDWYMGSGNDFVLFDFDDVTVGSGVYSLLGRYDINEEAYSSVDGTPAGIRLGGWNTTANINGYGALYYDSALHRIGVHRSPNIWKGYVYAESAEWYGVGFDGSTIYWYSGNVVESTYAWDEGWDQFRHIRVGGDGSSNGATNDFVGRVSFAIAFFGTNYNMPRLGVVTEKPSIFVDASFYNGTTWIELVTGTPGTIYGNPIKIPAEQQWLWLVKGLATDNYLHLKYVPAGSIFRIKYNGMVYEWRVPETCSNAVGLCEDYKIDIASIFGTTTLVNATVELVYSSEKVRFYVPSGFQVVVEGNGWSETHEVPLNSSYVDFGLPSGGTYTIKILGYRAEPRVGIETAGDVVRVTVTDEAGYAIPGAKVYVYDGSSLVATGVTNDLGMYEFNKTLLSGDQIRVVVSALKDGVYYHVDKVEMIGSSGVEQVSRVGEVAAVHSNANNGVVVAVLIILGLVVLAAVLLARGRRR